MENRPAPKKLSEEARNNLRKQFLIEICDTVGIDPRMSPLRYSRVDKMTKIVTHQLYDDFMECMDEAKIADRFVTKTAWVRKGLEALKARLESRGFSGQVKRRYEVFAEKMEKFRRVWSTICSGKGLDERAEFSTLNFYKVGKRISETEFERIFDDFEVEVTRNYAYSGGKMADMFTSNRRLFDLLTTAGGSSEFTKETVSIIERLLKRDAESPEIFFLLNYNPVEVNVAETEEELPGETDSAIESPKVAGMISGTLK
ncbi:hypothetical protein ACXWTF_12765 [Thiomicrolovo sp. ZZH C-3]